MTLSNAREQRQDFMSAALETQAQDVRAGTPWWVGAGSVDWMGDAACAEVGGDWWFPEMGQPSTKAQRICGMCAVKDDCLEYAIANRIPYGIWGGLTTPARERIRRQRAA